MEQNRYYVVTRQVDIQIVGSIFSFQELAKQVVDFRLRQWLGLAGADLPRRRRSSYIHRLKHA